MCTNVAIYSLSSKIHFENVFKKHPKGRECIEIVADYIALDMKS